MSKRKPPTGRIGCTCGSWTFTIDRQVNLLAKEGTDPTVYVVRCSACKKQPQNLGVKP